MQEIDFVLDDNPELSIEMVELDNRNRQAHSELQAFNEHKVFVYKHPITIQRKQYDDMLSELYEMKRNNPAALINEITNVTQNIRRIQSNINKKNIKLTMKNNPGNKIYPGRKSEKKYWKMLLANNKNQLSEMRAFFCTKSPKFYLKIHGFSKKHIRFGVFDIF